MTIATAGARYQRRAVMVSLLRHVVVRAMAAGHAGEGELIERRALELGTVAFARGSIFGGRFFSRGLFARRTRDGVGETEMDGREDGRWL